MRHESLAGEAMGGEPRFCGRRGSSAQDTQQSVNRGYEPLPYRLSTWEGCTLNACNLICRQGHGR